MRKNGKVCEKPYEKWLKAKTESYTLNPKTLKKTAGASAKSDQTKFSKMALEKMASAPPSIRGVLVSKNDSVQMSENTLDPN